MDIKTKLKTYSFWVSLASAILLLVQTIGRPLGLIIDETLYMSIVNSVLGVFVVLGIVSHPSQSLVSKSESMKEDIIVPEKKTAESEILDKNLKAVNVEDVKSDSGDCKINVSDDEDNFIIGMSKEKYEEIRDSVLGKK